MSFQPSETTVNSSQPKFVHPALRPSPGAKDSAERLGAATVVGLTIAPFAICVGLAIPIGVVAYVVGFAGGGLRPLAWGGFIAGGFGVSVFGSAGVLAVLGGVIARKKGRHWLMYAVPCFVNLLLVVASLQFMVNMFQAGASDHPFHPPRHDITDSRLISDRIERYYIGNDYNIGPGGPQIRFGEPTTTLVTGELKVSDLVDPTELWLPIDHYEIRVDGIWVHIYGKADDGSRMSINTWATTYVDRPDERRRKALPAHNGR